MVSALVPLSVTLTHLIVSLKKLRKSRITLRGPIFTHPEQVNVGNPRC